jgi:hypothetical protein
MDDLAVTQYPDDVKVRIEGTNVSILPAFTSKPIYQFIYAGSVTSDFVNITGGCYVWAVVADDFNGATVVLQALGPDGVTVLDVDFTSVNASNGIFVGDGTPMRVAIIGSPFNVYADMRAYLL